MFGLLSTAAKSSIRPPMTAGPISRNSSALNLSVNAGSLAASVFAVAAGFSLLLLLFFCSFWPGVESARRNIIEQHARIKRIHFVAMKPPTIFSAAWSGVANDTALDAGMQQMNFARIRSDPAPNEVAYMPYANKPGRVASLLGVSVRRTQPKARDKLSNCFYSTACCALIRLCRACL